MKIKQKPNYEPITIVLETQEEAISFAAIIDKAVDGNDLDDGNHMLAMEIANYFTTKIRL